MALTGLVVLLAMVCCRTAVALSVLTLSVAWAVPPQCERAFHRFWLENAGKTVARLRLDGALRGVWQTNDRTAAVPPDLLAITSEWIRLRRP